MLVDWVLPRAGMMISFLVLSGVMWSSLWMYDDYATGREAKELAKEIADQIAMMASMSPGYASASLSSYVRLPGKVNGANYVLTIDGNLFQVRVEVLGDTKNQLGVAVFPPSVAYYEGDRILELRGFETTDGDRSIGRLTLQDGIELRLTRSIFPRNMLVVDALEAGDELHP